ncbi:MAG: helix-turn-helix transcriptional regulator [Pseudomonadota bacterium]
MKKKDVPQDDSVYGRWNIIQYAVDENGKYVRAPSKGWDVVTLANSIAWEPLLAKEREILAQVKAGKASPLAFHMQRRQMDPKILGRYVGLSRWRVRRHLKPRVFDRLPDEILKKYADLFGITVDELKQIPVE